MHATFWVRCKAIIHVDKVNTGAATGAAVAAGAAGNVNTGSVGAVGAVATGTVATGCNLYVPDCHVND